MSEEQIRTGMNYKVLYYEGRDKVAMSEIEGGFVPRQGENIVVKDTKYSIEEITHLFPHDGGRWTVEVYLEEI